MSKFWHLKLSSRIRSFKLKKQTFCPWEQFIEGSANSNSKMRYAGQIELGKTKCIFWQIAQGCHYIVLNKHIYSEFPTNMENSVKIFNSRIFSE